MSYQPSPLHTADVRLSPELERVCETLARNAHEVWAAQRVADGWKFGPERNDVLKTHPSLIAYDELPESEKVYDRNAVVETIKGLIKLGYTIRKD